MLRKTKSKREAHVLLHLHSALPCGYAGEADTVAAINLLARFKDPEIHLFTP
ncbi:MAG: hypothetical protein HYV63_27840 [Candidatus Schekmanbacteria bacterium]|nr:hypothetical protein [Candidatus Schekmanbacteria bacterium]